MKKFILSPSFPKTEEVRQLEQEQKLSEEQQGVSTEKTSDLSSSERKWENWGFVKKRKNIDFSSEGASGGEEQSSAKKQNVEFVVSGKSDILISLDKKWALPIEKREKTYEFRKYKLNEETKRMWFYINQPTSQLLYIAEIESPVEYPSQIPENGIGNREFNQGLKQSKFAYKIKHLYKLKNPIGAKDLKSNYNISPPQKYTYVSKYADLAKNIIIEEQIKLY